AFGTLLSRYASRVRGVVGRMVASVEDAEELTQNVFVKAYEHLADFDEKKSGFATWLNRIAYNEAVDYLRSKSPVSVISIDEAV
ncbi:MAG: sigma-70 family RNA polymerase sigma factor, partial [Prevotellaceae bacterium]|nr:sigma-70 family RNA polymerase sigma factor [Prevotellaceae bacterium]